MYFGNDLTGNESLYEIYRKSARADIEVVKGYIRSDVLLTRRESFDFLFKVYVAGDMSDVSCVGSSNIDRDTAKFYARYFLKLTDMLEEGYSSKSIRKFFDGCTRDAWWKGISNGRYTVSYDDMNGVIYVTLKKHGKGFYRAPISNKRDLKMVCAGYVSYLVAETEIEKDRGFFSEYLINEVNRYVKGLGTVIYVDRRKHNLKDSLTKDEIVRNTDCKIVNFKASNY